MSKRLSMSIDVFKRLAKITGMVVGRNGKGGSGTCVRLKDGKVALLTAKHVVIECIRNTGEISLAVPLSKIEFHPPTTIWMDSTQPGDAAYLVSPQLASLPAIPFEEWTRNHPRIEPEIEVTAVGFPATFKKIDGRVVKSKITYLADKVRSVLGNTIICGINENELNMPDHLDGMSGAGLYNFKGEFFGIVIAERRKITSSYGEIDVLLPSAYEELYKPFSWPLNGAGCIGSCGEDFNIGLELHDEAGKLIATISSKVQTFWSTTDPENQNGRIGCLRTLQFEIPGLNKYYPINIESIFRNWTDDSFETRKKAAQEELQFLLMRLGWLFSDSGKGPKTVLKITPMI